MSLFDIYKAKKLGVSSDSLLDALFGKSMGAKYEEVELGTLTWYYGGSSGHQRLYSTAVSSIKPTPDNDTVANIKCSIYTAATTNDTYFHRKDKIIAIGTDSRVYVYDSDFTNASEFKSAMSGVMLKYEPVT